MTKRPNILFIHLDQMHFQALSAYGDPHVKTPPTDRMANDGYASSLGRICNFGLTRAC